MLRPALGGSQLQGQNNKASEKEGNQMKGHTWYSLLKVHKKLHDIGLAHEECRSFIHGACELLMLDIMEHPADWPVYLFCWYEYKEN